jgi:putative PIN family toxin of toxin-antitoxin system
MRIVLDTNVLVSGVLNAYGAPGRILDFILAGSVQIAYDDRLIGEYADVLSRPKFGFEPTRIRTLLNYLRLSGQLVAATPIPGLVSTTVLDPDDLPFAEVAVAAGVEALVTGNGRHFTFLVDYNILVYAPADFVAVHSLK